MWPLLVSNSGHSVKLLNRANAICLSSTARLAWADVDRVASTVGWHDIGERGTVPLRIELHAVANCRPVLGGIDKDPSHGTRRNVDHIVDGSATVGESSRIASEEAHAFLASDCGRRNSGVEAKQIGDWPGIAGTATGANRRLVLYEEEQVRPRRRSNWNSERAEYRRQQGIQHEVRELRIVLGVIHAEAILRAGSDDQFVDQRISFALDLLKRSRILLRERRTANRELVA